MALKAVVSTLLIYVLVTRIDAGAVFRTVTRVPTGAFAAAVALFVAQTLILGMRWKFVMAAIGAPLGSGRAIRFSYIGIFFNQTLPGAVGGDAVRVWHAYRIGVPVDRAISGVLLERITGTFVLVILAALAVWYLGARIDYPALRVVLVAMLPAALLGLALLAYLDRLLPLSRAWLPLRGLARLSGDTRKILVDFRVALLLFLFSVLSTGLAAGATYGLAVGLGVALSPWSCLVLLGPIALLMMVPVSFAGWGLREGAMVVMFGFLGVAPEASMAISVLFGLALLAASLPGGVLWLYGRDSEPSASARRSS